MSAAVDHNAGDVRVFESGAIMLYACEYFDPEHKLLPTVSSNAVQGVFWCQTLVS